MSSTRTEIAQRPEIERRMAPTVPPEETEAQATIFGPTKEYVSLRLRSAAQSKTHVCIRPRLVPSRKASMTETEPEACSNYIHYQLLLDTDVERCPNCGRKLWRSPRSKCSAHAVYACQDCFSAVQISEFTQQRMFNERMP